MLMDIIENFRYDAPEKRRWSHIWFVCSFVLTSAVHYNTFIHLFILILCSGKIKEKNSMHIITGHTNTIFLYTLTGLTIHENSKY